MNIDVTCMYMYMYTYMGGLGRGDGVGVMATQGDEANCSVPPPMTSSENAADFMNSPVLTFVGTL